jgi:hypothetical protein
MVSLRALPRASAAFPGQQALVYNLTPGASISKLFTVQPGPGWLDIETVSESPTLQPSRIRLDVPWSLTRLPRVPRLEAVAAALAPTPTATIEYEEMLPIGTLQLGIAADKLLVHARVNDARIASSEDFMQASSVTLFVSMPGSSHVGVAALIPRTASASANGFFTVNGVRQAKSTIQVRSIPTDGGYDLVAIIPMVELVKVDRPTTLQVNAVMVAAPWSYGNFFRATLSKGDSVYDASDKHNFATVPVK